MAVTRTTVEFRDDLKRALKANAAMRGKTMRQILEELIEQYLEKQSIESEKAA